jgi:phthiodiolone/phenolphthiodiolone dimycocerosates ketoreductase
MLETCVGIFTDRHFPAGALADQVRAYEAAEAVDGFLIPDQMASFIPQQLWTTANTPMAAFMADPNSAMDAYMAAAYAHALAPSLNVHLTSDSIRRPPAEQVQSMLTLAHLTEGRANFQIGGGEVKQTQPFGHPYKQGMSRMEDLFRIFRRFIDEREPIDFDGRRWKLERASVGAARGHRPTLWGLGGGPLLIDHSTSYADGLAVAIPNAWVSPEDTAEQVAAVRRQVAEKGRDPERFRIGLWFSVMLHEDRAKIEASFGNPIIRWLSAGIGRVAADMWTREGLALPFPEGWSYFGNLLPYNTEDALVDAVVAATTPEHVRRGWLFGTPQEVADQILPYLASGIDWVMPFDVLPVVGDPADAAKAAGWMIETCAALKRATA